MAAKVRVSAAILVAAVVVYFVGRTPQVESAPVAAVAPPLAEVDLQGAAAVEPATVAVRRNPVAGTKVLRVILEGIRDEDARLATVTLTGVHVPSWQCQGSTSEFDLDPFFASVAERSEGQRIDELRLAVDHPRHLPETILVPLSRGLRADGRTVFEARVRLVAAAVIRGRLARVDGTPVADGLVGALRLEETSWARPTTDGSTLTDVPIEDEGRAVECAADGAFELRVPASGRYALASYEAGRRPTTTRLFAVVGTRVDVGTIVLESGHAITGHALRLGSPMAGATISLTPPRVFWAADPADVERGMNAWIGPWRTFHARARSVTLAWLQGRFESVAQRADVDASGAFAFGGLAPCDYRLRVVELTGSRFLPNGWDNPGLREEGPDEMVVRAPAHGVVLQFHWTSIRFELEGDLASDEEGRMVLRTRSLYRGDEHIHIPEYWSTQFPLSGSEPTFVLQAPPATQILGEVTFPGRRSLSLDFWTSGPGGEVAIPVALVRAEEAATLVIELQNPRAEIPDTFTVMLKRGQGDATPDERRVEVAEGRLQVEDVVPGKYRVGVFASEDPDHPGIYFPNEFALEFHPGLVHTRSIRMLQGAGLRLTMRDADGELLGGRYEFYDDSGGRVPLCLVVRDRWQPGSDRWATLSRIDPYGTYQSSGPIQPGRYRLVLIAPGHANQGVTVELRAGEYEDVDVTLSK